MNWSSITTLISASNHANWWLARETMQYLTAAWKCQACEHWRCIWASYFTGTGSSPSRLLLSGVNETAMAQLELISLFVLPSLGLGEFRLEEFGTGKLRWLMIVTDQLPIDMLTKCFKLVAVSFPRNGIIHHPAFVYGLQNLNSTSPLLRYYILKIERGEDV